jgi:hypothetical protein
LNSPGKLEHVIQDKRQHPRIYVEVPTIVSSPDKSGNYDVVTIQQLSCGGCMVKGLPAMDPDRILNLDFFVGGKFVSVVSKVLYAVARGREILLGMKFLMLTTDSHDALEEFIGRRLQLVR